MKKIFNILTTVLIFALPVTIIAEPSNNWWNQTVFYEIFVRSFYDKSGNGIGDFNGITEKLDYLNDGDSTTTTDLGVKGIWLMPINSSPSYHGYDVTNYKAVNSQFGTKTDFKNMVTQAHNRGIKVIIDFVINHTSSSHPWFVKSAANDAHFRNFYRWSDTKPTYTGPWGQEVWYLKNGSYYYALFWDGMPDLNYEYQPVKDSIYSAAKYWLDSMNVDGFRLDAAMYLYENGSSLKNQPGTYQFWTDFNAYCKSIKPSFMMVGEVWDLSSTIKTYNNKIDYCFEFNLASAILKAASTGTAQGLVSSVNYSYSNMQNNQFGTFLTNHDQDRVFNNLGGDLSKMKVAASIYLTLPGNPYLYYGEEIGMQGSGADENKRTPMQWTSGANAGFSTKTPWEAVNADYATYNVQTMQSDPSSLFDHYRKLIQARNKYTALKAGTYTNIGSSDNAVFMFLRQSGSQKFIVMVNTANKVISNLSMKNLSVSGLVDNTYALTDVLNNNAAEQMSVVNSSGSGIGLKAYESKILLINETASVADGIDNQTKLNIYPNPAKDILNIEVQNVGKDIVAEIYSLLGERKFVVSLKVDQINTVSVTSLSPGIYFIRMENGKTAKFLKQ